MAQLQLTLPDGNTVVVPEGATFRDAVGEIGAGLLRNAVAVTLDDVNYALDDVVPGAGGLQVITRNSPEGLDALRHSAAHLLAWAVQELHPDTKFAFGPAIEHGFYYDFDREDPFTEEDLTAIEDKMRELAARKTPILRNTITAAQGRETFADQPYKIEQIESLGEVDLSTYVMGAFTDLCEGPHVPGTGELKAFKLLNVAGAYWRGDSENQPVAADLRHRVLQEEGSRRASRPAGGGPPTRPPQAGTRAGSLRYHGRGGPRPLVLVSPRRRTTR